jgi:transposase
VPVAPVVHTDDTGWRVGGEPASLRAFETDAPSVSQSRPRHRHEEVQAVMPADYAGVMGTDRGRSDEAQPFDRVDQQKGLAHVRRSINNVVETKTGRARDVGAQLTAPLQEALARWHTHQDGPGTDFQVDAEALQAAITDQLRDRRLNDPDNQRLLKALGWHHDRGTLRRFLADPPLEPTNNRAERALRPAVIARNGSQCSKNRRGAQAFAAFTRVVRTLAHSGVASLVEDLYPLVRSPTVQAAPS